MIRTALEQRCYFCGGKTLKMLYPATSSRKPNKTSYFVCTNNQYGIYNDIAKCRNCGLTYVTGETKENKNAYIEVEDPVYLKEMNGRVKTFSRHLDEVEEAYGRKIKLRILDVGAHTGIFVKLAKERGHYAEGIEPSSWCVKKAKERFGVNLRNDILRKGIFKENSFDIVALWDVIEHMNDPLKGIKIAKSYLKPNGMLVMSTIDIGSAFARMQGKNWIFLMIQHLFYFDKKTMRMFLLKEGFKKIRFKPHWRYLSLGYLSSRFWFTKFLHKILVKTKLGRVTVPFYVNDVFNVYAFK